MAGMRPAWVDDNLFPFRSRFLERGLPMLADLPTLIVWGDADIAFRANERRRWEALLPRHYTVVLAGAGHYLQSDAPTEFADAIAAWHNQQ